MLGTLSLRGRNALSEFRLSKLQQALQQANLRLSGIMSFIVSQDGVVYEKNLGKNTTVIASAMTTYDPDSSWNRQ